MSKLHSKKETYNFWQVLLHWIIAALVLFELTFKGEIKNFNAYLQTNLEKTPDLSNETKIHISVGIAILTLMLIRLLVRVFCGVPANNQEVPPVLTLIARWSHYLLYFLLFITPITGILSWLFPVKNFIFLHQFSSKCLVIFILFHICATFFSEGVLGHKILHRMITFNKTNK